VNVYALPPKTSVGQDQVPVPQVVMVTPKPAIQQTVPSGRVYPHPNPVIVGNARVPPPTTTDSSQGITGGRRVGYTAGCKPAENLGTADMIDSKNPGQRRVTPRRGRLSGALLALLALTFSSCPQLVAAAEMRRMALLVGNADYYFAPLKNPLNDANDLGRQLDAIGFETTVLENPGYAQFRNAITTFYDRVSEDSNTLSVFYYAGHAVQMNNVNYLIAVDSKIVDQQTLIDGSISINDLLRDMQQTRNRQNLIILDACRDNPFKAIEPGDQSRGVAMPDDQVRELQQGLAPVEAPAGTIIAYATAPGGVAKDGKGRNGTYTRYLLEHLTEQRPVEEVFKRVRKDVMRASRGEQIPWEHSSLSKAVYFYPPRNEEIPEIGGF
jgi:hypothetical protein